MTKRVRKRRGHLSKKRTKRVKTKAEKAWNAAHSLTVTGQRGSDGRDSVRARRKGDLG